MIQIVPPQWKMQPFEQDLLIDEVEGLTGSSAKWKKGVVVAPTARPESVRLLVERLAFGAEVVDHHGEVHLTRQARLELAAGGGTRKVTSHALHGIHPYKGKFYPQLARALLNACGVESGSEVHDPFAGCGTTVLEASLMGMRGTGTDVNPLAVEVANTKLKALKRNPDTLAGELSVLETLPRAGVPTPDEYLESWFPRQNLRYLLRVLAGIQKVNDKDALALAKVCLSSVLRKCSYQEPSQIRVYRRKNTDDVADLSEMFPKALSQALSDLVSTREALRGSKVKGSAKVVFGDARTLPQSRRELDAVVTSPPYANALPYIDTDRLSLRAFSLLGEGGQRAAERRLIGNREITDADAKRLMTEYEMSRSSGALPGRLVDLIQTSRAVASEPSAGFRKRRTPALLYAYFRDMGKVLEALSPRMKPGAPVVLVVGDSTVAGPRNSRLAVPTSALVSELAASSGFQLKQTIAKPLTSFSASTTRHRRNAMANENVLVMVAS